MIPYAQQITLLDDATFRARVRQSAIRAAHYTLADPSSEAKWPGCHMIIRDPGMASERVAPGVAVLLTAENPTDAQIDVCVDSILPRYYAQ
jgi:hypothetical protein